MLWRQEFYWKLNGTEQTLIDSFAQFELHPLLSRRTIRFAVGCYVAMKMLHLAVSLVCLQLWRSQTCAFLLFATALMFNFGISHGNFGVSVKVNFFMVVLCLLIIGAFYFLPRPSIQSQAPSIYMLSQGVGSLVLSFLIAKRKRKLWSKHDQSKKELDRLLDIFFDLVPPKYSMALIKGCGLNKVPSSYCRVVALQLDISGFTVLSQTIQPWQLATAINTLFCDFDEAVLEFDLFKVDTVGDAYILVGFLDENEQSEAERYLESINMMDGGNFNTSAFFAASFRNSRRRVAGDSLRNNLNTLKRPTSASSRGSRGRAESDDGTRCRHMLMVADTMLQSLHDNSKKSG